MAAPVAAIHELPSFRIFRTENMDGRDEPGHDDLFFVGEPPKQFIEFVSSHRGGAREAAGKDGAPFGEAHAPEVARRDAKTPEPEL